MSSSNNPDKLMYSFNTTTQLEWKTVTVSQDSSFIPMRRICTDAVTDNNGNIYIFGGATIDTVNITYSNEMIIFDTINKIWINGANERFIRAGQTDNFLPDTNKIVYIGGYSNGLLMDMVDVCIIYSILPYIM